MKPRLPEIINLLKRLQHDPHWKDFQLVYNYFDKITSKLINELLDNMPEKQEDYRLYLFDFLIRTKRILSSIVLLAIYGKFADMNILHRPLLENIIQTKMLLKGRRTKSVRAINLYRLINKIKEHKNLMKEPLEDYKDINILFEKSGHNYSKEIEKLEKELTNYCEEEIYKMEKKVQKGVSWHGRSIKGALKECESIDDYEDYDDSCRFIHVRDYRLNIDHHCNDNHIKIKLFSIALSCIFHLEDFKKIFPKLFVTKRKNPKEVDYAHILEKLIYQILLTISPSFKESIEKLNLISVN